jgi:hypothetical protein
LRGIAEVRPKPNSAIGGYCSSTAQNVVDATGWHAKIKSQTTGAQVSRGHFAFQKPARMDDWSHDLSLVIIDNLDVECVTIAEFETNPPTIVDGHCPLLSSIAFQLVQSKASQWTEVPQATGGVQRNEQFDRGVRVNATKVAGRLTLPNLPGRRIPPAPDHG